ncbi:hypothetical protein [Frigoriglobus tundricola]|uniref:Uncharacterized protein n=1 Tax=Frigoriglobus tundricola TaxID=2774151 RepID=A0A6M5YMK4_9BACT|nr:hypothetical protein [Frigoriglobus tundricola]QJW94471.1 hypothetical protein FTUN_1991 [Frigoriglobus tundricola]
MPTTKRDVVVQKLTQAYTKCRGLPYEPKDDNHIVFHSERRRVDIEVLDDRLRLHSVSSRTGPVDTELLYDDRDFERNTAEFIGRYLRCYFSTYWMEL